MAVIEVSGLSKHFGDVRAVDDLSFTVDEGRIVGFLGPNGAGKTTTLRMLLGLVKSTSGSATIDGAPFGKLDAPAATVGAVLDDGASHPGRRGRDHLRTLARASGVEDAWVDELLELVHLGGDAHRRTKGYSLGMRQRLGLAAALLGNPRVLILDEPANGLDPQGIRWLRDFLRSLAAQGRSILVSSHVLAEIAQTADDVVVIRKGKSVMQAPLAELMSQASAGIKVSGPDVERLAGLLTQPGVTLERDESQSITAHGITGEEIGRIVARHSIHISELSPLGSSLEDVFFELTGSEGGPG